MIVVLIVIAVAVIAVAGAVAWYALRGRPPRREDGVASFQRHLDALSPQARRQVIDRVKKDEH